MSEGRHPDRHLPYRSHGPVKIDHVSRNLCSHVFHDRHCLLGLWRRDKLGRPSWLSDMHSVWNPC
jgi:hypothetical protein